MIISYDHVCGFFYFLPKELYSHNTALYQNLHLHEIKLDQFSDF